MRNNIIDSLNYLKGPTGSSYFYDNTYENRAFDFITMATRREQAQTALSDMRHHLASAVTEADRISRKNNIEHKPISYFEEFFYESDNDNDNSICYANLDTLSLPRTILLLEKIFYSLDMISSDTEYTKVKKIHDIAASINTKICNFIKSIELHSVA